MKRETFFYEPSALDLPVKCPDCGCGVVKHTKSFIRVEGEDILIGQIAAYPCGAKLSAFAVDPAHDPGMDRRILGGCTRLPDSKAMKWAKKFGVSA